jgi:hypothetical protein
MEDSMEVWVPLLSALVGGLIAVVPVLITLRNQAQERERDRLEQKKEAKTQLEIELVRNDIKVIDEMVDRDLKILFFYTYNRIREFWGEISEDQLMEMFASYNDTNAQLAETRPIAVKLAASLGEDIGKQYHAFIVCAARAKYFVRTSKGHSAEEYDEAGDEADKIAAELHTALRDKLVSIRDS